jgi:hypothetical protein
MAIALMARAAAAGSISLQWDPNLELDVAGYRVFVGDQPGVYTSSVDVGNITNWAYPDAVDGKRYCFTVAAYSAGPRLGARSAEVCTQGIADDAPTLVNPGNQTHQSGAALTLTLVGSDPEGNPVTYSATGLPTGLVLNKNTGFVSGTPSAPGAFSTKATVSDGKLTTTQAFNWTIQAAAPGTATPLRPTGTIATATPSFEWESVATATTYRLWVDDASANDIQIDYTPAQAGCTTAGAVCRVSPGVALAAGRASWSVRSSNPTGGAPWSGALDFTVQLPVAKGPTVSIVTPTLAKTYLTDKPTISLTGVATDATQVTWTSNRGGSGAAAGTKTWSANSIPMLEGKNILTITARDAAGGVATATLTVSKVDTQGPSVRIVVPTVNAAYSTAADALTVSGTANDESSLVSVKWDNDRGGSATAAGTNSWVAADVPLRLGANVITIKATDAAGNVTTDRITVTKTADAPAGAQAPKPPTADATVPRRSLPKLRLTYPSASSRWTTTGSGVRLRGVATDNVTRVVWSSDSGASGVADGTDKWVIGEFRLQKGVNKITLTASDVDGRTDRQVLTITYNPR